MILNGIGEKYVAFKMDMVRSAITFPVVCLQWIEFLTTRPSFLDSVSFFKKTILPLRHLPTSSSLPKEAFDFLEVTFGNIFQACSCLLCCYEVDDGPLPFINPSYKSIISEIVDFNLQIFLINSAKGEPVLHLYFKHLTLLVNELLDRKDFSYKSKVFDQVTHDADENSFSIVKNLYSLLLLTTTDENKTKVSNSWKALMENNTFVSIID